MNNIRIVEYFKQLTKEKITFTSDRILCGQVKVSVLASVAVLAFHQLLAVTSTGNKVILFVGMRVAFGVIQRTRLVAQTRFLFTIETVDNKTEKILMVLLEFGREKYVCM